MRAKNRRILVLAGLVLIVVGMATWFVPLVVSPKPLVSETVETRVGSTKTTTESLDWGDIHSDELLISLTAAGLVIVLLGCLPPGAVRKISIFGTEIELGIDELKTVVAAAAKAEEGKPGDIVGDAIEELGAAAENSDGRFTPSLAQLEAAVDRAIERERKGQ